MAGASPVAYDCDGTGKVCRDDETGKLVPVGDVESLGRAIRGLAADAGLRARLTAAGRALVETAFDARTMVRELEEAYELARSRAGEGRTA